MTVHRGWLRTQGGRQVLGHRASRIIRSRQAASETERNRACGSDRVVGGIHVADEYELRLIEDTLSSGAGLQLASAAVWRVVYVAHGAATVAGQAVADNQAAYAHGAAEILAGNGGAAIWRWELAPIGDAPNLAAGLHRTSRLKLSSPIEQLAASGVLMRADSVTFPPGGCAYLHTHRGPGAA
jgi:hypothetical protein